MGYCSQLEAEISELYEENASRLARYGASFTDCADQAGDAVQETFLRYFAERRGGRVIESPRAWLYHVLRDYLVDGLASASATGEVGNEFLSRITDPAVNPEELVHRLQIAGRISACLSAREKECLGLRSEGFSYIEIAEIMGLRTGTVGALLARAHQKIRIATEDARAEDKQVAGAVHHLFRGGEVCPSG